MNKNVLVFGGSGFIGSYVIEELLANNYNVLYADLNPSSSIRCSILDNATLCKKKKFKIYVKIWI